MARTRTRLQNNNDKNNRAIAEPRLDDEVNDVEEVARKDRPTPSARKTKPRGAGSTGLVNRIPVVRSIVAYIRGVFTELQKVTWPTREETTRLTGVVLAVTAAFAIGLGILDTFFSWWFRQAFHADSEWIFLVVAAGVAAVAASTFVAMRRYV